MTSSPISIPACEEANAPTPTASLLSPPPQPTKSRKTLIAIVAAVIFVAFLFHSSSTSSHRQSSPPLRSVPKLPKPFVVLISADGFRYGYQYKNSPPCCTVRNGTRLRVFLKEELPERLNYSASERIAPIIGLLDEGYKVEVKRLNSGRCGGTHGYDNAYFSMRSIFVGLPTWPEGGLYNRHLYV